MEKDGESNKQGAGSQKQDEAINLGDDVSHICRYLCNQCCVAYKHGRM